MLKINSPETEIYRHRHRHRHRKTDTERQTQTNRNREKVTQRREQYYSDLQHTCKPSVFIVVLKINSPETERCRHRHREMQKKRRMLAEFKTNTKRGRE